MSSKQKGNKYERKVSKDFTEWWGTEFYRAPGSGSLHWSADLNLAGDVVTGPEAGFPFVIEAKNRQSGDWTLESIVLDKHDIKNWWAQVVVDARRVKKTPMLVFTRNRAEDFVMIPYTEEAYNMIMGTDNPVMRTWLAYEEELTKQKEKFDVLVTTITGLSTFVPEYWKENTLEDWDTFSRLSEDVQPPEIAVDDIMNKLKK